jgi:hypothetical protein
MDRLSPVIVLALATFWSGCVAPSPHLPPGQNADELAAAIAEKGVSDAPPYPSWAELKQERHNDKLHDDLQTTGKVAEPVAFCGLWFLGEWLGDLLDHLCHTTDKDQQGYYQSSLQ